jgi:pimeloyl-ACP methyl ester carboxylesterase
LKTILAAPDKVRRLVLTATSGGVPMGDLGVDDWRPDYRALFPHAAEWITEVREDLTGDLAAISSPTLLLFGDADAISPPAVGERLAALLPNATLEIIPGGDHDLAYDQADEIAGLIAAHLA